MMSFKALIALTSYIPRWNEMFILILGICTFCSHYIGILKVLQKTNRVPILHLPGRDRHTSLCNFILRKMKLPAAESYFHEGCSYIKIRLFLFLRFLYYLVPVLKVHKLTLLLSSHWNTFNIARNKHGAYFTPSGQREIYFFLQIPFVEGEPARYWKLFPWRLFLHQGKIVPFPSVLVLLNSCIKSSQINPFAVMT